MAMAECDRSVASRHGRRPPSETEKERVRELRELRELRSFSALSGPLFPPPSPFDGLFLSFSPSLLLSGALFLLFCFSLSLYLVYSSIALSLSLSLSLSPSLILSRSLSLALARSLSVLRAEEMASKLLGVDRKSLECLAWGETVSGADLSGDSS